MTPGLSDRLLALAGILERKGLDAHRDVREAALLLASGAGRARSWPVETSGAVPPDTVLLVAEVEGGLQAAAVRVEPERPWRPTPILPAPRGGGATFPVHHPGARVERDGRLLVADGEGKLRRAYRWGR